MNIFLGSIYPQPLLEELTKRQQFVDYPANIFQRSLIKGLDEHLQDLRVVTSPVIKSTYKRVKDICIRQSFSHKGQTEKKDVYVGTLSIPILQLFTELWRVYRELKKIIKTNNQKCCLFVYALHSPFLITAVLLRNKIDCTCVIVPDLPEFMSKQDTLLKKIVKRIDRCAIDICLKRLDCFVLLSSHMRERLPIKEKKWVLMEGIFDTKAMPKGIEKCKERVILYCGNLSKQYGIIELLEAFSRIERDNYRLWICGRGNGESAVRNKAKKDKRIKYFGVVNHDEVLILQQQATVLINPRSSAGEYTKYSFPSKTMEYLASGTPTIMCHLPAIPSEYDDYIFYIEDESVEGIQKKIEEICDKPQAELNEFGKKASDFIITEKNANVQSRKVIELVNYVI